MSVDDVASTKAATAITSAVTRTATDALNSKYSAIILAEYPVLSSAKQPHTESKSDDGENYALYRRLLHSMADCFFNNNHPPHNTATPSARRQTPLINLGYAIRVANVLHHVKAFVSFHEQQQQQQSIHRLEPNVSPIPTETATTTTTQLVILGAGLDVTGLWYQLLQSRHNQQSTASRHVVEIDMPSICRSKADALRQLDILREQKLGLEDEPEHVAYRASLTTSDTSSFTLVRADLHDIEAISQILDQVVKPNVPTLIVCELVLAYLTPQSCDALLRLCNDKWQSSSSRGSCILLYEPLGPPSAATSDRRAASILESYQHAYSDKFNAKLHRGQACDGNISSSTSSTSRSSNTPNDDRHHQPFHPLATSSAAARDRLLRLGFAQVHAATAGMVACRLGLDWTTKELFDEHAALSLHLATYSLVCAFPCMPLSVQTERAGGSTSSAGSMAFDMDLFRAYMCGTWIRTQGLLRSPLCSTLKGCKGSVWISSIIKDDEAQVRRLFSQSYKAVSEQYVSIRKMVKSALRSDLGVASVGASPTQSAIGKRYCEMGGDFLVALRHGIQGHGKKEALLNPDDATETEDASKQRVRQVVGAIGLRQWTSEECASRTTSSDDDDVSSCLYFEIQRFFVDDAWRGHGIGAALLHALVDQLRQKFQRPNRDRPHQQRPVMIRIVATTPTILQDANRFYASRQFVVSSTVSTGDLTMQTYTLTLKPDLVASRR